MVKCRSMRITIGLLASMLITACSAAITTPKEQQEALSVHNQLRAKHGAPKLVWNDKLARYAERYAIKCKFKHSGSGYGENLAAGYPSIKAAINAWYGEKKLYNAKQPGFSKNTGHFTQLVWKSSTDLGCGLIACDGKHGTPGKYLVCEYSPAGNVVNPGYFQQNVAR